MVAGTSYSPVLPASVAAKQHNNSWSKFSVSWEAITKIKGADHEIFPASCVATISHIATISHVATNSYHHTATISLPGCVLVNTYNSILSNQDASNTTQPKTRLNNVWAWSMVTMVSMAPLI